jgi:hypothetical protein
MSKFEKYCLIAFVWCVGVFFHTETPANFIMATIGLILFGILFVVIEEAKR